MAWTKELVNKLKIQHSTGKTAREIAEALGPNFTRNSVIGKLHRLGISGKSKNRSTKKINNIESSQSFNFPKRGRKNKFRSFLIESNFEPAKNLTLEELTDDTCKYMPSSMHPNEPDATFCGRKTVSNSKQRFSYCPLHIIQIYQEKLPKGKKEEVVARDDEVPQFIEKKIKLA